MSKSEAPTAEQLAAVYKRASAIIVERGFTTEYSFKSGSPVDLSRAIGLAQKDVGYSTRLESALGLLGDYHGRFIHEIGKDFDEDDALDFLEDAVMAAGEIAAGKTLPPPEKRPFMCVGCGKPIERRRGRQKYHPECKPEDPS